MEQYAFASITELARSLALSNVTAESLTTFFLNRIANLNPVLHAFVCVFPEQALAQARQSDERRQQGKALGMLDGIPLGIKDLCDIEGTITTCGSRQWETRISSGTADVVQRLQAHGAVIIGKTHTVEFAFGGWGTNPLQGTPRNPWDRNLHRVPGGSSSGSGVAVAAGLVPGALGTDTGGSVRIPAALNGITGLKTTVGLVNADGVFPLSRKLDSVGPMTRTADDAALLLQALTHAPGQEVQSVMYPGCDQADQLAGMRICVLPEEDYGVPVQRAVRLGLRDMARMVDMAGATIIREAPPFNFQQAMSDCGKLIAAEGWRVHRDYIQDPDMLFGPFVRDRLMSGKSISDMQYQDLLEAHQKMQAVWTQWMADKDALMLPTTPSSAIPLAQVDESVTPLGTFTRFVNWVKGCALALPAGFDQTNLPVSVQLTGKAGDEAKLLHIGSTIQSLTAWHSYTPVVG
ncbi:glutamyl-tRNA(Gln) amidotransferase subunit A [Advenella mimigardefordensis DPN7]|uniref:Glutamyl-tRNA(Gln) amidotransferase subunit A n=2 Tax=Advenella mimigardefordensis TaxID=302406 RepID=W0PBQ3_ADVMD|nr:glutamyl-tRNA(Gln) amidotransferase subunit A [Advenella mimigardefordensis DPN7]